MTRGRNRNLFLSFLTYLCKHDSFCLRGSDRHWRQRLLQQHEPHLSGVRQGTSSWSLWLLLLRLCPISHQQLEAIIVCELTLCSSIVDKLILPDCVVIFALQLHVRVVQSQVCLRRQVIILVCRHEPRLFECCAFVVRLKQGFSIRRALLTDLSIVHF